MCMTHTRPHTHVRTHTRKRPYLFCVRRSSVAPRMTSQPCRPGSVTSSRRRRTSSSFIAVLRADGSQHSQSPETISGGGEGGGGRGGMTGYFTILWPRCAPAPHLGYLAVMTVCLAALAALAGGRAIPAKAGPLLVNASAARSRSTVPAGTRISKSRGPPCVPIPVHESMVNGVWTGGRARRWTE